MKSFFVAHKIISAIILLALLGGGYFGYKKYTSTAGNTRYVTAKAQRGTITASVSGSGQVSSLNQIDIKTKVSGDVLYLATQDGQKIGAGGLIAKLDDKDAQKSVRDAEINLESAKISLSKLEIEKSDENMNADLVKAYDDGFNTVSNVFIDLPEIMTGLNDMFFKSSVTTGQWNVDWYEGQVGNISNDREKIKVFKKSFTDSYQIALKAYDKSFDNYKIISRTSNSQTIEDLITQTYDTTKLVSDAVKNANNYIDFIKNAIQRNDFDIPAIIATHKTILSGYTSDTNTHLINLQSTTANIKDYKDAFPNSDLDIQSAKLSVKQKENALQDAKDKLADYFVRAPFSGTVAKINIKKSDTVGAGTVAATLITKTKLAEISMNEIDVAKMKLGQKATLTFDAIPDLIVSGVVAEIDSIGAVAQGVVTYNVKISFDTQDERVKTAMSISAEIVTNTKQNVLVIPNSAVKSQAGKSYVEMFNNSLINPNKVTVKVGLTNDSESEIISGIKEGDEIVTRVVLPNAPKTTAPNIFGSTGGNRAR